VIAQKVKKPAKTLVPKKGKKEKKSNLGAKVPAPAHDYAEDAGIGMDVIFGEVQVGPEETP
jgi:hypothetical protein